MKKKILAFVITMVVSLCAGITVFGATSTTDTIDLKKMKVKWSDEFTGTTLNRDYWTPEIGNGDNGWGNNELEYYMDSDENIDVSNGTLKITAKAQNINGFKFTSARLKTQDKVECGYGYVEARIKLPSVNGIWPAFWMLGENHSTVGWPKCGEIDIMEAWNTGDFAQNCLHYANDNSEYYETEPWRTDNWSNFSQTTSYLSKWGLKSWNKTEWHTYGVYKTETQLIFYYDGKIASRVIDITKPIMSEVHDNYFILLNVACGGNLAQNVVPNAADLPSSMEVDYVRYYIDKTPEEIEADRLAAEKEAAEKEKAEAEKAKKEAEKTKKEAEEKAKLEATKKAPNKAVIKSIKNIKKKSIKLGLKKISGAVGYQIRYCDNKKFQGYQIKNTKKLKVKIKKLNKKTTYWVKVRAYKMVDGQKKYGKWSKAKKVKIKK